MEVIKSHLCNLRDMRSTSEECNDIEEGDKRIETEIKALRDVFKDEGIRGLRRALSKNSNKWKTIALHIAVTGSSGTGKSAFINAIRDVSAEDDEGADVGEKETTKKLTPYRHPKNPNFIVWDMPGVGTPNFPKENYLQSVKFDRYDFFVILSKSRFKTDDLWLAQEVQKQGKCFYFIRTSIDIDIYNSKRSRPNSHSQEKVIETVRQDCHNNLEGAGFDKPHVFLIDNFDRQLYDFWKLEVQLVQDCDGLKMEAMALSLTALTVEVLQMKKKVLEERIEDKAMEIACLEDDHEEQRNIFDAEMNLYIKQFNLDRMVLSLNKDILSLSDENLKEVQHLFSNMVVNTERSLTRETFSVFGDATRFMRKIARLLRRWGWMKGKCSQSLLQFCSLALLQNLEEVHKTALKVYNLDAQKGLVKSVMSVGKKQQ